MERALLKHAAGTARVIPIMVRPVDFFEGVPFAKLQALPQAAKPITQWSNQDAAWADVARGIRMASQEMRGRIVAPDAERIVSQETSVAPDAEIPAPARSQGRLDAKALDDLYEAYWTRFSELVARSRIGLRPPTPRASNYARFSLGSSDRWMNAFASIRDRYIGVELVLRQPRYTTEYARLEAARVEIEQEFGGALEWKELQDYRIALPQYGFDIQNRAEWARQHDWLIDTVKRFQQILLTRIDAP